MQLSEANYVSRHSERTYLFVLLTLIGSVVTSEPRLTLVSTFNNKRLDVTAQNVTTYGATDCYVTCQQTSGCVSVNMSPDRRTCQLLSEETSDMTSLQSADGWSHLRKCQAKKNADAF